MSRAVREYVERRLSAAEAQGDRVEARLIAFRLIELLEQEDFDEWNRLQVVPLIQGDYQMQTGEDTVLAIGPTYHGTYQLRIWGDPVLTQPCEQVRKEQLAVEVPLLADAMRCVLRDRQGVGISAPQVGASLRVALIRIAGADVLCINPRLEGCSAATTTGNEGCLSVPGFETSIKRHTTVRLTYRDDQWIEHSIALSGFSARCAQHETDHLDGVLIVQNLTRQLRRKAERMRSDALTRG